MRVFTVCTSALALTLTAPLLGCGTDQAEDAQPGGGGGGGDDGDGDGEGDDGAVIEGVDLDDVGLDGREPDVDGPSGDCTFTQGFWKNHEDAWPVPSIMLGTVAYTQVELLAIFGQQVSGNGLIALAHQLIAAKLNVENGAGDTEIADEIAGADLLIGGLVVPPVGSGFLAPEVTSALVDALDAFNQSSGDTCGGGGPACGDGALDAGEACDDGNTADGDGCSATCTIEVAPCCGDGVLDAGEQCDDGNTVDGDGCSATCTIECTYDPMPDAHCDDPTAQ